MNRQTTDNPRTLPSVAPPTWRAYVDIELETEQSTERRGRAVLEQHCILGRTPGLSLTLDHDTVSRKHAEIFCDPFGRWWVRDLGSTNGTTVNGERVEERVLRPGDRVGVGDYRLTFHAGAAGESKTLAPQLADTLDGTSAPSWVRTLREVAPPQISATQLSTLMRLSRTLLAMESNWERMTALAELLVSEDFHARIAAIVRIQGREPMTILCGPHRAPSEPVEENPYISRTVLKQAVDTGEPVLGSNLPEGSEAVEITMSADIVLLASIAVPIRRGEDSMDLIYANLPPQFGRTDWLALFALAGEAFAQAEVAWEARRHAQEHAAIERELQTARTIQHALVPKKTVFLGLELSIGFQPCRWVGGDYVDCVEMSDGRVLCTIADVCGKGLQAALVTFSIHTMIRALADYGRDLTEIIERLNSHLSEYLPDDSFVTMLCVAIDPRTGAMEYVNCGHLPPYLFGPLGNSRRLSASDNPPLGIAPSRFSSRQDRLAKSEILFIYTDGLTELCNASRQMLGEEELSERLAEIYRATNAQPIDLTNAELGKTLDDYRGDEMVADDSAFLLARRLE